MAPLRHRFTQFRPAVIVAGLASIAGVAIGVRLLPFPLFLGVCYLLGLLGVAAIVFRVRQLARQSSANLQEFADMRRAIDHAAIVATTDVTGRITYVNDKFCEISKYTREELLGQDHRIINSGYHPKDFMRDLWRTIASGRVWHGELRNRAKDGSYYWVDTTIVPFLNTKGKPYQYIAIRADITARKAAEQRLAQQAALARVGQMAAIVAHEVRNPLAGIKGALQVLISRRNAGDPELPVMRDVVTRIDALGDLINDLMVYARPRAIRPAAFTVRPLLDGVVSMLRRDQATAIDVVIEGPDVTLTADAELLSATILNLLLNAAQAMNGNGRITVSIATQADDCVLAIRDTGPGIALELREQIFEPFFTTKARGGGLGLSIAKRTAELHGGGLTVACPDTGGSVFTLTLPLRAAPDQGTAQTRSEGVAEKR